MDFNQLYKTLRIKKMRKKCSHIFTCDLLFHTFTIKDWMTHLTQKDSFIYELIKEEVEELFYKTGGYLNYLDFESCYSLAIDSSIRQINKNINKNKKCFFEIKGNNNSLIYKILKERLVTNIKNLFDKKRKTNVINIDSFLIDSIYQNFETDIYLTDLKKLANQDSKIIVENIIELVKNYEINLEEAEELGEKLNIDFSNIFEFDLSFQFMNIEKDKDNQTFFIFNCEEVA